jgi:archaellum component FlaC
MWRSNEERGIKLDPPAREKYKRLEALNTERAQLEKKAEGMSGAQITMLKAADIEGIIKQVSKSHLDAIKDSHKYSASELKSITTKWNEENKKAPLAESQKQVEELKKIRETLKSKKGLDTDRLAPLFDKLATAAKGATVNLSTVEEAKKQVIALREAQEEIRDNLSLDDKAGKAERAAAGQKAKELKKAEDKLEKLEEKIKDIPEQVGGEAAPAAFKKAA